VILISCLPLKIGCTFVQRKSRRIRRNIESIVVKRYGMVFVRIEGTIRSLPCLLPPRDAAYFHAESDPVSGCGAAQPAEAGYLQGNLLSGTASVRHALP
jgi:hypothetical protein